MRLPSFTYSFTRAFVHPQPRSTIWPPSLIPRPIPSFQCCTKKLRMGLGMRQYWSTGQPQLHSSIHSPTAALKHSFTHSCTQAFNEELGSTMFLYASVHHVLTTSGHVAGIPGAKWICVGCCTATWQCMSVVASSQACPQALSLSFPAFQWCKSFTRNTENLKWAPRYEAYVW